MLIKHKYSRLQFQREFHLDLKTFVTCMIPICKFFLYYNNCIFSNLYLSIKRYANKVESSRISDEELGRLKMRDIGNYYEILIFCERR